MSSAFEDEAELCPYSQRRLPRELYVKFFVVAFTTLASYGHLIHLRHEPRPIPRYVLVALCPISGAALAVVPLLAMSVQIFVCRGDRTSLKQSLGILIGRLPHATAATGAEPPEAIIHWPPNPSKKMSRRIVAMLALLVQSVSSIVLFVRRVQHGSETLYDHRILQFAILGLSVSIMSILHLLLKPELPWEEGSFPHHHFPKKVTWLFWLRPAFARKPPAERNADVGVNNGRGVDPDRDLNLAADSYPNDEESLSFQPSQGLSESISCGAGTTFMMDWLYAIIALFVSPVLNSEYYFGFLAAPGIELAVVKPAAIYYFTHCHYWFIFVAILAILDGGKAAFAKFRHTFGTALQMFLNPIPCLTILAMYPFIAEAGLKPLTQNLWHLGTLFQWDTHNPGSEVWRNCTFDSSWEQITTFGTAPTFCACPKGWRDDAADYLWWLA